MNASVQSSRSKTSKRNASRGAVPNTTRTAVGFLMLYMTGVFLNVGQSDGEGKRSTRFASSFLTLFVVIFILNQGRLGVGPIYLLLTQLVPDLAHPAVFGPLFMLYYFLLQDSLS